MVETMKWERGSLILLDQTRLPLQVTRIICKDHRRVIIAIKKLEVRGAPAIGAAAAFAMVLAAREAAARVADSSAFMQALAAARQELNDARPTAVNLSWATGLLWEAALAMEAEHVSLQERVQKLEETACAIYEQDIAQNKRMGDYGATIVPSDAVILTHCNAGALATCGWGTALGVIRSAWREGKVKMVYADETRPLLQGSRLTAWELMEDGIPVTVITDNMAARVMQTKGVNLVITGADRIAANGDTANKIGTYGVALAARAHGISFYVAAPASTFDFAIPDGSRIPIEERGPEEVRSFQGTAFAPPSVPIYNPAFDVTPADCITGIITEYGILSPPFTQSVSNLKAIIAKEEPFPWKA